MPQIVAFPTLQSALSDRDRSSVTVDTPLDADIQELLERGRETMLSVTNRIEAFNAQLRRLSSGEAPVGAVCDR